MKPQSRKPDGNMATFTITNVGRDDGGRYCCSYRPELFISSETSNYVEILLLDPSMPRPHIFLSPAEGVALGRNITLRCQSRNSAWRVYLFMAGQQIPHQLTEANAATVNFTIANVGEQMRPRLVKADGDIAVLPINNLGQDDGGKYRCSHRLESGLLISSETSDDVDMVVVDPGLPRPVISIGPSGVVVLGGRVTIRCEIEDGPGTFYFHRAGDPTLEWLMKPDFDVGEHSISNVSWTHQGN
ncbi:hypothetical protein lerEdw1_020813 [Lerista edwardsae]|nr:hypothetical protein lerEdw1_020813 [Lerista edwardsae]